MAKDPKLDCYAVLGVHPNAEDVVIRAAFKALAQRYHPDRFSGSKDEAHRKMSDLTSAYEVLADPVQRRKYDRRRRLYARTAAFYIKDPSQDRRKPVVIVNHVSIATRQRRYRIALTALMAAVVVLTAFNLYQYSGRLKEWMGSSPAAPPVAAVAKRRGTPDAPIPAISGAAPAETPPQDASATKAISAPIGQVGATRAIGPSPAPAQVSLPGQPVSAAATQSQPPAAAASLPARSPTADSIRVVTAPPVAVSQATPTLRKETRPTPAKPAVANNASANRPATTSPAVAASQPCTDVVAALGLCNPNSTGKDK